MSGQEREHKSTGICLAIIWFCLSASALATELHSWTGNQGQKNISTIPRHGFDPEGRVRRHYNPNSIQFQHRELRKALRRQAAEIAASKEQVIASETGMAADSLPAARVPKEGIMGLGDLIKLERRGGRYTGEQ
ncbi:MAG: hypothetical protein ACU84Q_08885 [Gammaproteobacteria bacterium]